MNQQMKYKNNEITNNGRSFSVAGYPNSFNDIEKAKAFINSIESYNGYDIANDGRVFHVKGLTENFFSVECAKKFIDKINNNGRV